MTKAKQKQVSKLCLDAADVILRDGFQKGDFGTPDGPKCAVGALRAAYHGNPRKRLPDALSTGDFFIRLFKSARPRTRRQNLVDFNDADRTRKHDVVELLRDMAAQV